MLTSFLKELFNLLLGKKETINFTYESIDGTKINFYPSLPKGSDLYIQTWYEEAPEQIWSPDFEITDIYNGTIIVNKEMKIPIEMDSISFSHNSSNLSIFVDGRLLNPIFKPSKR